MITRLHDWQRIYKSGARYLGRDLWVYVDRTKPFRSWAANPLGWGQ